VTLENSGPIPFQVFCDRAPTRTVLRRVFRLIDSFNVGGTESQAVELARRLPAAGYEVTVSCLKREVRSKIAFRAFGIPIRQFRLPSGIDSPSGLRQLLHMSWFLRSIDIVHTHDLWSNLFGVPARLRLRTWESSTIFGSLDTALTFRTYSLHCSRTPLGRSRSWKSHLEVAEFGVVAARMRVS
jgi:Glycosyltransferase Family 4